MGHKGFIERAGLSARPRSAEQDRFTGQRSVCIVRIVKNAYLIKDLRAAGWVLDRVRGSHHLFKHSDRSGHVVPHPKKDLGIGLIGAIRKQAGL
jgi:predicted RNA binding protein YcfA (HicA-like mRNA interferase family)